MSLVLLAARAILYVIFATAALGKISDREGAREGMRDFGVPLKLAPAAAFTLPIAELLLAVALLAGPSAWIAAIGAAGLLAIFSIAIAVNIARGRRPDCHCFGAIGSGPIGRRTLARNAAFIVLALFVAVAGGPARNEYDPSFGTIDWVALGAGGAAFVVGAGLLWLMRRPGAATGPAAPLLNIARRGIRLLRRILGGSANVAPQGLPVGEPAPSFELPSLEGEETTLDALRAEGRPVLLVFTDPNCEPCGLLYPELGSWQRDDRASLTVAVIANGDADANRARSEEHSLTRVLLQQDRAVSLSYLARATPTAVLVTPSGEIASRLAEGVGAVRALAQQPQRRSPDAATATR